MILKSSNILLKRQVKCLLEQLQHICNTLTDENEINIIKQHAVYAKRYTTTFICKNLFLIFVKCELYVISGKLLDEFVINLLIERIILKHFSVIFILISPVLILLHVPIWPRIFYIFLSINDTRPRLSPLVTEYFVDHKRYFYSIIFHANAAFFIGIIVMLATGTMFIVYVQHACGMFRIAR